MENKNYRPSLSLGPSSLSVFLDNVLLPVIVRAVGVVRTVDRGGRYGFSQAVAHVGESKSTFTKQTKQLTRVILQLAYNTDIGPAPSVTL